MRALRLGTALIALAVAPTLVWADGAKKAGGQTYQVPYRMTNAQHILVRAKINGKGPYNFILDTGAPALFVSTALSKKLGVEPDAKGWGTFDRFEIEGGVVFEKAKGRIETPFQLEGMNSMGLAGAELHGVIGYNVLARYRMEFDFTRDKMAWTALAFDPPPPEGLGGKAPVELNAMGGLMKLMGTLLGKRPASEVAPRGFLGLELADANAGVTVKSALGPAAAAGLKAGDRVAEFEGQPVKTAAEVHQLAAKVTVGTSVKLTVARGGETLQVSIKAGEGL